MGQRSRAKPEHLAAKLLEIRNSLGLSQSEMAERLALEVPYQCISEFERGMREPDLMVLLRYAKLARTSTDVLIDDKKKLEF